MIHNKREPCAGDDVNCTDRIRPYSQRRLNISLTPNNTRVGNAEMAIIINSSLPTSGRLVWSCHAGLNGKISGVTTSVTR